MSDQLKAGHFYLPNLIPDILGDAPLIRIPLEQDPLAIAVHGVVTNILFGDGKDADEILIPIMAVADAVMENLNPIGGTIFDPIIGVISNKTWYDTPITSTRYEGKHVTEQYSADTPDAFVWLSQAMDTVLAGLGQGGKGLNAFQIQYLTQQYTGFLGQIGIPALTKENGKLGGAGAAIAAARKRITSDPLLSNDAQGAFYDAREFLGQVADAYDENPKKNTLGDIFRGMDAATQKKAAGQAKDLTKGVIEPTYKQIKVYNDQINDINKRTDLTDHEKYVQTSDIRRKMLNLTLRATEKIGAFYDKYVRAPSLINGWLFGD